MRTRIVGAMLALTFAALFASNGHTASTPALTLANLKGPIAKACGQLVPARTIAELWAQINGCKTAATVPVPVPTPTSTPTPAPSPTATPSPAPTAGYVKAATLDGAAPFHATFDISKGLETSGGTGVIPGLYTDDLSEGAFRFVCGGDGAVKYDDPVLYPGQPGKSHLHQPWGNKDFSASTTAASLGASLATNCNNTPFPLNRSSYWMPAMLNDQGQVISPDLIVVYYKRITLHSRYCTAGSGWTKGICVGLPNEIRFIFGWNPVAPTAKVEGASWYCTAGDNQHHDNLDDVFASGCTVGSTLVADTLAPDCWDGKYLDSPDHRSHMAYGSYGDWGYLKCDAGHPYVIPQQQNKAMWTVTADMIGTRPDGTKYSRIKLSSDAMLPGAKPGQTLHADYTEKWVAEAKALWLTNCIERALSCNAGDLGNGTSLIGAAQPAYGWINPNPRQPIPPMPPMPGM